MVRFRHKFLLVAVLLLLYLAYMSIPELQPPIVIPIVQPTPVGLHSQNNQKSSQLDTEDASENTTNMIYEPGHMDNSSDVCPDLGKDLQVIIVITSAPSNYSARMAIRQTWGHYAARRDVAIAFILGSTSNASLNEQIHKEEYLYGDLIRGKFVDTYDHLTLKTISMLEWVGTYCPKAAFLLKTDDDMFINVARLLAFIAKRNPARRSIYGCLASKWEPIRIKTSKYYISMQQYQPAHFPDFTTGPAYLLPARLAKELYDAALNHTYALKTIRLEDVFLTGIVANSLKIERINVPGFFNLRALLVPCSIQRRISIHGITYAEQYDIWKMLLDGVKRCKKLRMCDGSEMGAVNLPPCKLVIYGVGALVVVISRTCG